MKRTILVGLALLTCGCDAVVMPHSGSATTGETIAVVAGDSVLSSALVRVDDPDRGVTCYVFGLGAISCVATSPTLAERSKP